MADTNTNPAQEYVNSVGGMLREAFNKDDGISGGAFLKALKFDFQKKFHSIWDKITDADHKLTPDDNIFIPVTQKTLTGADFTTLYNGKISSSSLETDQGTMRFLKVNADYDTELRSGYCTSPEPIMYNALSDHDKAVYEITLLSKAYADIYDGSNTGDIVQNYGNAMSQYKTACESRGMHWETVLADVSTELQTENYWYKKEGKADEFDKASEAHALMLTAAGPDFKDRFMFVGDFKYEDTISEHGKDVVDKKGIFATAGTYLNKGSVAVTNAVGSVWSSIRQTCKNLVDKDASSQPTQNPSLMAKPLTPNSVLSKDGFLSFIGNSTALDNRAKQAMELTANINTADNSDTGFDNA